jgi:hypothetical protein
VYVHRGVSETNLGVEGPGIAYVSLESFCAKLRMQSFISKTMHIYDVFCYVEIDFFVALIQDDEKQVETAHDWGRHRNVSSERLFAIVPATDGVRSSEDGRARVERGVDARLGDRYSLLFHRFMNGNLVRDIHFVELVNGTDPVIRQHQGTGLDGEVSCLFVFDDRSGETRRRGSLSRGINSTGKERANIPIQSRLGSSRIRN